MEVNKRKPRNSKVAAPDLHEPVGLNGLGRFSRNLAIGILLCLSLLFIYFCGAGLPEKPPQDPSTRLGCPLSWLVFMGVVYTLTFFTTDQYASCLPRMEIDLHGSQALMSATIQMNFVVKGLSGLVAASLSDRIGRRPVLLTCLLLLSLASLCCFSADTIECFIAARILQGMGESAEAVVFAMVRDYFPENRDRYVVVAALQLMSTGGMSVSPVIGGWMAETLGWRISFLTLSVLWGFLGCFAFARMVESCPDGEKDSYFTGISRIFRFRLVCLLMTETCNMAAFMTFWSNISYLTEVSYGRSAMTCSVAMLTFGGMNFLGLFVMERLQFGSVLQAAKISASLYASTGLLLFIVGSFFSKLFWAYLLGTFLQAFFSILVLVTVNVLFMEPLQDCAGMAASVEICAKSILPSIYGVLSTQTLIHSGPWAMIDLQAAALVGAGVFFFGSLVPSQEAHEDALETQ